MKKLLTIGAMLLLTLSMAAYAQKPVTEKETATVKATIDAIDHDTRMITLKDSDGNYETIYAGPEIRRFDELKVGDKVTFKYTESVVYQLRKAGEGAVPTSTTADSSVQRNPTPKPSGSMTEQMTTSVTVKSVDMKTPAVTVESEDGRKMTFKVKDKGKLKGVNPGDHVVITYTSAIAVSVE